MRADEHRVTKMKEDGFVFLFLNNEKKMFMEEESRKSDTFSALTTSHLRHWLIRRHFGADFMSFSEPVFGVIFPAKSIISGNIN